MVSKDYDKEKLIPEIRDWLKIAKKYHATHLLIVQFTPQVLIPDNPYNFFLVTKKRNVQEDYEFFNNLYLHTVLEVYSLQLDEEMQIKEKRAMHFD